MELLKRSGTRDTGLKTETVQGKPGQLVTMFLSHLHIPMFISIFPVQAEADSLPSATRWNKGCTSVVEVIGRAFLAWEISPIPLFSRS